MEWSDSQGLDSADRGAQSTVGGADAANVSRDARIAALPDWLREARNKALAKERESK